MGYWIEDDEDDCLDDWNKRHNDRIRASARYRLKDKIKDILKIEEKDAREIVDLLEEMMSDATDDVYDRVKERGQYDRYY